MKKLLKRAHYAIYILLTCVIFSACDGIAKRERQKTKVIKVSETEYKLKPFTYKLINTNFGTEAIKITSDGTVWIDRVEIPDYLDADSLCNVVKCDWVYILIEVRGDRIETINRIASNLSKIASTL